MKKVIPAIFALYCALAISGTAYAQNAEKTRVAIFGFLNLTGDNSFDVPAESSGSALYISMRMLGAYEVSMPESIPRSFAYDSLSRWCVTNGIDYVLYGTLVSSDEGQEYSLSVFNNAKKSVTVRKSAKGSSVMDVFGISDKLILAVLDTMTGHHVGFGSLKFQNTGATGPYSIMVDGMDLGENPKTLDHVTRGSHQVQVFQGSAPNAVETAKMAVTVSEGKTETVTFELAAAELPEKNSEPKVIPAPAIKPTGTFDPAHYAELQENLSAVGDNFRQETGAKTGFIHNISPFSIGKYEVTYELWYSVYQWATSPDRGIGRYLFANPGREGSEGRDGDAPTPTGKDNPVTMVNWRDCIVWCNAYGEMTGVRPVYYGDKDFLQPLRDSSSGAFGSSLNSKKGSADVPYVKKETRGYRLPTEGEWQFAASCHGVYPYNHASGSDASFIVLSEASDIDGDGFIRYSNDVAWSSSNSDFRTHPVGTKAPNRWDLYDMSGNVWEWTFDWDGDPPSKKQTDYSGPSSGSTRIIKGGGWLFARVDLQLGSRGQDAPYVKDPNTGFRICRSQ